MSQTTVMQMAELYLNLSYMNYSWPLFTGNESELSTNESHATNSLRSHRQAINTESIYLLDFLGANDERNHCWMMDMSYRQSTTRSSHSTPRSTGESTGERRRSYSCLSGCPCPERQPGRGRVCLSISRLVQTDDRSRGIN